MKCGRKRPDLLPTIGTETQQAASLPGACAAAAAAVYLSEGGVLSSEQWSAPLPRDGRRDRHNGSVGLAWITRAAPPPTPRRFVPEIISRTGADERRLSSLHRMPQAQATSRHRLLIGPLHPSTLSRRKAQGVCQQSACWPTPPVSAIPKESSGCVPAVASRRASPQPTLCEHTPPVDAIPKESSGCGGFTT